ncbi:MAG: hypothetical protein K0Q43_858 [Ramlibacter sp.]|jgi:hypothetical protein|nr:hypothetical protein [Ramlibacter sp.]
MSDNQNFGFGKFVPGFDFLQNLAKGASQTLPQMPNLSNWVAPTLNLEELDKRIGELKAVHFWLDQNSKALGATIQALEVQKMTLATLKGMNFNMGDVANALKLKAADTMFTGVQKVSEKAADTARTITDAAAGAAAKGKAKRKAANAAAPATGVVDPLQWWGALTQQFQEIAAGAMKDAASQTAVSTAKNMATGVAKEAMKTATGMAKAATKRPAKKAAR